MVSSQTLRHYLNYIHVEALYSNYQYLENEEYFILLYVSIYVLLLRDGERKLDIKRWQGVLQQSSAMLVFCVHLDLLCGSNCSKTSLQLTYLQPYLYGQWAESYQPLGTTNMGWAR